MNGTKLIRNLNLKQQNRDVRNDRRCEAKQLNEMREMKIQHEYSWVAQLKCLTAAWEKANYIHSIEYLPQSRLIDRAIC